MRLAVAARALLALALIWSAVWGLRTVAATGLVTAEGVAREVERAALADWSAATPADPALAASRREEIRRLSGLIGRLDFQQRAEHRRLGTAGRLFDRLNAEERALFVELTIRPGLDSLLQSMETLPPRQRRRFLDLANGELARQGVTADPGLQMATRFLGNMDPKALRAALPETPPETLFQLGPLVEAVNEALQGMIGHPFGPPSRSHSPR
ncbi:MAG: hypothetical protein MUF04_02330 [Akkermansiaceae bacterium]|jgi:hypothetical protein|nr:hypothetical protein [Akkermansiaceae bacterium]